MARAVDPPSGGSVPIYLRAGSSTEREIGAVTFDGSDGELDRRAVGRVLREVADELDPPAPGEPPWPDGPDERAQRSPRDRQVRAPRRNR